MSSSEIPRLDCAGGQPLDGEEETGRTLVRAFQVQVTVLLVCLVHSLLLRHRKQQGLLD